MRKKYIYMIGLLLGLLLASCTTATDDKVFYMVKNEASYESYWTKDYQNLFVLNLAFNHSPALEFDQSKIESIELLPSTDLVKINKFFIEENPPQNNLNQKALFVHLLTQKEGTHVFTQIAFNTKNERVVLDLGKANINIQKGVFSGISALSNNIGVFSKGTPLEIAPRNENKYPVMIKGIKINNPYVAYSEEDVKIVINNQEVPIPKAGYQLKPKEQIKLIVNWKINFPPNQIVNIDLRPLLISERQGMVEYSDIPNMIFRNDF